MNGKIYDENGNVIYEFNNNIGSIKQYYNEGELKFEDKGKYLNGKLNGKGKNIIIMDI